MFAPIGYKLLADALEDAYGVVDGIIDKRYREFQIDVSSRGLKCPVDVYPHTIYLGTAAFIIREIEAPLFICSPEGLLLRPSWKVLTPKPKFLKLEYPLVDSPLDEIFSFIPAFREGYFLFIDQMDWVLDIPDMRGLPKSLTNISGWDMRSLSYDLRQFHRYSLCVPEDYDCSKWLVQMLREAGDLTFPARGRPALVPKVAEVLREQFDDERRAPSWKALARQVSSVLGRPVSESTVQRAARHNAAESASKIRNFDANSTSE